MTSSDVGGATFSACNGDQTRFGVDRFSNILWNAINTAFYKYLKVLYCRFETFILHDRTIAVVVEIC
ncbi:hypothetical protein BDD12DRAFT_869692 [Trichophaea hybrida]|nr:hypothetical protein BDD12DRAFT_869692 [Trichophaea hybrida]